MTKQAQPERNLVEVTLTKSAIGYSQRQKDTVRALGLRRIGDVAVHADTPPIRGMIQAVNHLVSATEVPDIEVDAITTGSPEDAG
jgi:large subunit ribosomal protein L30